MSSKFLRIIPLKSKTGKAVTSAFQSIFKDPKYLKPIRRRPVWVRTDKWKEFLNKSFQDILKCEGIEVDTQTSNAVIEKAHRTIRDKLYKYFTFKNTYRYIDVLQQFVQGYNAMIHSRTGMAPVRVTF
jgi:transposase InsO family protein